MLETYFLKPETLDRFRASWIGPEVERYVAWLGEHGYSARSVCRRVPLVWAFGEFARQRGAGALSDLPAHLEPFVADWVARYRPVDERPWSSARLAKEVRGPLSQMLEVTLPGYEGRGRPHRGDPFAEVLPGFFEYLVSERGLRPATILLYRHHLRRFEAYLRRIDLRRLAELTPVLLSAFVAELTGAGLAKTSVREACGILRVFLRYARREGTIGADLAESVEWPQVYRLSDIPRSIAWADVAKVLAAVERRSPGGKRDYAILLLLITYGLRAAEVAALTLDDIDWRRERLAVPERKAGHATAFPLTATVGAALVDYLQHGRPATAERQIFFRVAAPRRPLGPAAISSCASAYLRRAGVQVPRPGSHTLRHTVVSRLVEADFGFKEIGDFVGHRSPASTQIYAKVAIESLREIALGDGEEVLG